MEYTFDRYDHLERLEDVKEYKKLIILVVKGTRAPCQIFAVNGSDRQEYKPLCFGVTEDEIEWKLTKIKRTLERDGVQYKIEREIGR